MVYCQELQFSQKPDYNYLKQLFYKIADRENFNLDDKVYDWTMKAITIQCFPQFYDFKINKMVNPFNKQGMFDHFDERDSHQVNIHSKIVKMAKIYKFRSNPKQLMRLISGQTIHKSKNKENKELEYQMQIADLHDQKQQLLEQRKSKKQL